MSLVKNENRVKSEGEIIYENKPCGIVYRKS